MRQYLIVGLALAFVASVATSCSKENPFEQHLSSISKPISTEQQSQLSSPIVVEYEGVRTLKFRDDAHRDEFAHYIGMLEDQAKIKQIDGLGGESFLSEYYNFGNKIDSLLEQSTEESAFLNAYSQLRDLANPYMVFTEEEAPICRAKSPIEAALANKNGVYLVGDRVESIELYSTYADRAKDPNVQQVNTISDTQEFRTNNAFAKTKDRKARIEFILDPRNKTIHIRCSAQSKGLFGIWNRSSTIISGKLTITELTMPFDVQKFEIKNPFFGKKMFSPAYLELENGSSGKFTPAPFKLYPYQQAVLYLKTAEVEEIVIPFGRFNLENANEGISSLGDSSGYPKMKGHMEVWSRGIRYENRGISEINVEFPTI